MTRESNSLNQVFKYFNFTILKLTKNNRVKEMAINVIIF